MLRFVYPLAFLVTTSLPSIAAAFELSLPIACEPGGTCLVQNLVDTDPGPARADAFCGKATYDGHRGTDFRVADIAAMRTGVDVLAAAPGRVKAVRDGERDAFQSADAVRDRECGNGLVVDHGDGWETQYCHLARDSIRVAEGARVRRGQALGRIGMSGRTEFPHLHLSVRKDGRTIDPASGHTIEKSAVTTCASNGSKASLWDETARQAIRGDRTAILSAGFSGAPVDGNDVMRSRVAPAGEGGPLVFYAQFMNVRPGDRLDLLVRGPDGTFAQSRGEPFEDHKAVWTAYAGKRTVPSGRYTGTASLVRDGRTLATREVSADR